MKLLRNKSVYLTFISLYYNAKHKQNIKTSRICMAQGGAQNKSLILISAYPIRSAQNLEQFLVHTACLSSCLRTMSQQSCHTSTNSLRKSASLLHTSTNLFCQSANLLYTSVNLLCISANLFYISTNSLRKSANLLNIEAHTEQPCFSLVKSNLRWIIIFSLYKRRSS
jgi:hypothetical protein